jgi:uncharacterized repeat protein (TIGR01451 family)
VAILFIAALFVPSLSAQTAPANSVIGNQASAIYNDASGVSRQAFSNLVQTTVSQVFSGRLDTAAQTRFATVGTQVVFPHTYTNTGNGTDTVNLSLINLTNVSNYNIYIDANGDGVPDNTTPVTSVVLAANQVYKFVVVGTLTTNANGNLSVNAVSAGGGTVTNNPNTDSITATSNAAIAVTKAMSATTGNRGDTLTVTLTYTNTGNVAAKNVAIVDNLGSTTTQFAYYTGSGGTGSGQWSGVSFADTAPPSGLTWTTTSNVITATVAAVAPGQTGTISFQVKVGASAGLGTVLPNTANYNYIDTPTGSTNVSGTNFNTNTVNVSVLATAGVQWTAGDSGGAWVFTQGTNNGGSTTPSTDVDGTSTTAVAVNQGGTIAFTNTVTNNSGVLDTFNISYTGSSFPAGTTFQFFRSDGITPLTDSNGDGIVDVGPVAAGSSVTIKVKAILPTTFTVTTNTAYQVSVVATSTMQTASNFATANHYVTDKIYLTTVGSVVDITLGNGGTPNITTGGYATSGAVPGKGTGVTSGITDAANPGSQVIFPFFVENTSTSTGTSDAYSLQVTTIPTGWTLAIHQAATGTTTCPASFTLQSTSVTSTPALAPNSYQLYCVELDIPANYAAGAQNFTIQALSNATAASDTMAFSVSVNTFHSVSITPNQSGQIYAGGTIVYKHVITNGGNTQETVTIPTVTNTATGWTAVIYNDTNNNGSLDSADLTPTASYTLSAGATQVVFLKLQAPASANPGDSTDSTVTVTYNGGTTAIADDLTTVITGQVRLVKSQALSTDATCGTYGALGTSNLTGAKSGYCVQYSIAATNTGTGNVTSLVVADAPPPYTSVQGTPVITPAGCTGLGAPTPTSLTGSTVPFSYTFTGPMVPNCTVTVTFVVKLN